jgi:N-acetylmuramoyl-L-alanine amidase
MDFKSPNFSHRKVPIDSIIIHHTGGKSMGCVHWLCDEESGVSAHYIIVSSGLIYQLVADHDRAWHAGRSAFDVDGNGKISEVEKMWNDRSIGIELEAVEPYKYTPHQLHSLEKLCYEKMYEHHIQAKLVLGHKEIAPGRKIDPANFDMTAFREDMVRIMAA